MEKRIPKRRFKEFIGTGEWEEKKLGEVADRFDNLRIPIAESKRIPGVTPYYGANGIVDYIDGFTHDGEFVLLAEDGANDLNNYPVHYVNGKVWVNNHAHVIQGMDKILKNIFLVYCLKTIDISSYLVGGSRAKLNADIMMKLNISIPSLAEQEKIGNFFQKLDRLIDLNRQKLDKLKASKSAYLEEMFPREGEDRPRRRFKGFTGKWEEKKLGEVVDIYDGTHQTPNYTEEGIMFLSVENIKTLTSKKYISKQDFKKDFKVYPEKGDILMTRIGDVGTANIVKSTRPVAYYVSLALLKNNKLDSYFLKECIATKPVQMELWVRTLHIAFPKKINKNEIGNVSLSIPSLAEQEKIGHFFKKLDDQIGLQEEKLEKLEKMKKAYLAEMFV